MCDTVISNDGIWYELYHHLTKEENNVENFDMKTLEKVETGIDLLSFTKNNKILFSEMKSSISNEKDYKLFCYGVLSQFTKKSKDVAQFSEFVDVSMELGLIDTALERKINNLIDSEEFECSIAKNILMDNDYSGHFEFEVLIATSCMEEINNFRGKMIDSHKYNYSKAKECCGSAKKCDGISCVLSVISNLEEYSIRRDRLEPNFDLKKVYKDCIEYIDGIM